MSSLILKANNTSNSGGSGEGDTTNENDVGATKDAIVVSAAVHVSPSRQDGKYVSAPEVNDLPLTSSDGATVLASTTSASPLNVPLASISDTSSNATNTNISVDTLSPTTTVKIDSAPLQSSVKASITSSATVVVTAPLQGNASSQILQKPGSLEAPPASNNSTATTVITAVPSVSAKLLPLTTQTQQLPPKFPQQPSPKISNIALSTNQQAPPIVTNQSTTVIGPLRNNITPPISFTAGTRPHQLTIPNVNSGKPSTTSPTITLSPIKPQGSQGATLVTAIQSSQAQHHPSGTVLVSNNATSSGATIVATHRQLHSVNAQPHRQIQQTLVQQQPSTVARVAPTLIAGHLPGTHQHVVQHHPPPLRMVHLPTGATAVTGGTPNLTTRIAVSGSGNISSHVPPTTVSLPQCPAPIAIRHALPQSPLARNSPASNTGISAQLPRSPIRQPQLPQTPLAAENHQPTALLTTSRSPHSAPPAHLSSTSVITHHPQPGGNTVVNRTGLPLASVLASANQQRQLQQQIVTQRVLTTGPGGATTTVVQGIQQPHPGLGAHSLSQANTGTIMVNPQRSGTISMLPQVPASGTVTAGGLLVHHPSSSGGNLLSNTTNQAQIQHSLSGSGHHQLVSFPSNPGQTQATSNQRIALPTSNVLAHLNGAQHHGSILTVSAALTTSGSSISKSASVASPAVGRQMVTAALAKPSATILPPNALHHLLGSHPHPQHQLEEE